MADSKLRSLLTLVVVAAATGCPPVLPPRPDLPRPGSLGDCTSGSTPEGAHAGGAGCAAASLTTLKGILHAFVEEDPTLSLDATAEENANAIIDELETQTNACADATLSVGGADSATLDVDFGEGCDVVSSGLVVAGAASVTVAKAGGTVTVTVTATALAAEGYTFDGTASIATDDLLAYTLSVDVTADPIGDVTFEGTTAVSGSTIDDLAISFDGAGTFTALTPAPVIVGPATTCVAAGALTLEIADFERTFAACHAGAGTVAATQEYTCSRERVGGGTTDNDGTLTLTLAFDADTSTSGAVTVTAAVDPGFGDEPVSTTTEVQLPSLRTDCAE